MPQLPTNGRIESVLELVGFTHVNKGARSPHFVYEKEVDGVIYRVIISKNKHKSPPLGTFNNMVDRSGLPEEIFYMKNRDIKKQIKGGLLVIS